MLLAEKRKMSEIIFEILKIPTRITLNEAEPKLGIVILFYNIFCRGKNHFVRNYLFHFSFLVTIVRICFLRPGHPNTKVC